MIHSLIPVRVRQHPAREEDASSREQKSGHVTVMLKEAIELLSPKKGDVLVDGTAGAGGHSEALLRASEGTTLLSIDADETAVEAVRMRLAHFGERARVVHGNFGDLEHIFKKEKIEKADKVLFDLGWNSGQLSLGRGFSFMVDEPLIMSYGEKPASGFTAKEILNDWEEGVIADALFGYGEERYARRIAKAVVMRRKLQSIETTIELVEIIRDAVPAGYRHGRLHFATKTFQGLRIAVNDELGVLERGLKTAWEHLNPQGRIAVITFHSIEDRVVKRYFAELAKKDGKLLMKKPLPASPEEVRDNPRARSAKLRGIEKI